MAWVITPNQVSSLFTFVDLISKTGLLRLEESLLARTNYLTSILIRGTSVVFSCVATAAHCPFWRDWFMWVINVSCEGEQLLVFCHVGWLALWSLLLLSTIKATIAKMYRVFFISSVLLKNRSSNDLFSRCHFLATLQKAAVNATSDWLWLRWVPLVTSSILFRLWAIFSQILLLIVHQEVSVVSLRHWSSHLSIRRSSAIALHWTYKRIVFEFLEVLYVRFCSFNLHLLNVNFPLLLGYVKLFCHLRRIGAIM